MGRPARIPKDHPPDTPLPDPRREELVQLLAKGETMTKAAELLGYSGQPAAWKAYHTEPVMARYEYLTQQGAKRAVLTIESLFKQIVEQATYDPVDLLGVTTPEDLHAIPEAVRRLLIKGWHWDKQGRLILDLVDKEKAIDRLARHLGFYNDTLKVEISSYSERLRRAQEKLREIE